MSEFKELKAEYIRLAGKNPPPMSVDALRAKVTELQTAAAETQKPAVQDPPAKEPRAEIDPTEADRVAAEKAEADRAAAEKAEADRVAAEKAEADRIAAEKTEADRAAAEKADADGKKALFGSDILPATIELTADVHVQLGDVVRHAFDASGLSVNEFNAQHPSHREEQLQASIAAMRQAAEQANEEAAAPSLESELSELGLSANADGDVEIEMLTGLSGPDICLANGDLHRCSAAEAVRMVRAGFAQPR